MKLLTLKIHLRGLTIKFQQLVFETTSSAVRNRHTHGRLLFMHCSVRKLSRADFSHFLVQFVSVLLVFPLTGTEQVK